MVKLRNSALVVVDLKRLSFSRILDSDSFGWLGCARIPEVVYDIRRFLECLTGREGLRRFTFHLQHHGTFQHNNETGRRVMVFASFRPRQMDKLWAL